jgi:hypothetical protein
MQEIDLDALAAEYRRATIAVGPDRRAMGLAGWAVLVNALRSHGEPTWPDAGGRDTYPLGRRGAQTIRADHNIVSLGHERRICLVESDYDGATWRSVPYSAELAYVIAATAGLLANDATA